MYAERGLVGAPNGGKTWTATNASATNLRKKSEIGPITWSTPNIQSTHPIHGAHPVLLTPRSRLLDEKLDNMMLPWWERWLGRLEYELGELDQAGIPYERDEAAFKTGITQLNVRPQVGNEQHQLVVVFPDLYPEAPFEVFGDDLTLDHHQNPFAKNLCFFGRDTANWRPSFTLAAVLQERLPTVLQTGRSGDAAAAAGLEEQQAEPIGDYYPYACPALVSVDSSWHLDKNVRGGTLLLGSENADICIRAVVLEVRDDAGALLECADEVLSERYPKDRRFRARWVRADRAILEDDPKAFCNTLKGYNPQVIAPKWERIATQHDSRYIDVVGVVFPQEAEWRQTDDGWVFLVRVKKRKDAPLYYFARAGYIGRSDLAARVPELKPLGERRVVVVGLGALGMPSALAFARSGIREIRAIDFDTVDPGTAPRWPLGLAVAGLPKAAVLEMFVQTNYPYTQVRGFTHRLGVAQRHGVHKVGPTDSEVLADALNGADLVYDAAVEEGIHLILEHRCRALRIPYVCVSGTNGVWGGSVVRTRPGTGCWHCFRAAQQDGTIATPVKAPTAWVQPVGCGSPTFTGAGFDLEPIALAGVRMAVGTLTGGAAGGYPDAAWDVAVGDFRDGDGQPIPPRWREYPLPPRPGCPACNGR